MSRQCTHVTSNNYSHYAQHSSFHWMWILIIAREQELDVCVTSGFRREVDETCTVLPHYAASSGNFLPTFRDNPSNPSSTAVMFVKTSLSECNTCLRTPTNIGQFIAKFNAVTQNGRGGRSHLDVHQWIPYRRPLPCRNSRLSVKLTTHLNPLQRLSTTTHGFLRLSPLRLHSKEYFTLLTFLTLSLSLLLFTYAI